MRKFKVLVSGCLALSMVLSAGYVIVPAKNSKVTIQANEVVKNKNIQNNSKRISFDQAELLFDDLKEKLEYKYQGVYQFDNFQAIFNDVEKDDEFIDVDIVVDMTLIRNPKEAPYVQGMIEALNELHDPQEKEVAQKELDEYLAEVMPYYNVPDITTFSYRIKVPSVVILKEDSSNYEMFYRADITDEVVDLAKVPENEVLEELGTEEDGEQKIARALNEEKIVSERAVTYSAANAVAYAKNHATDEPEFSKANGMGSDCANFVSKCINAGGIPVDKAGKWYPSPSKGSYVGENWMRTGYYDNGGVKTYMTNKGYFKKVAKKSAKKGGFMFWNNTSHVALVVCNDGTTIKYSQHSNVKQSQVTKTYSSNLDVDFYNCTKYMNSNISSF